MTPTSPPPGQTPVRLEEASLGSGCVLASGCRRLESADDAPSTPFQLGEGNLAALDGVGREQEYAGLTLDDSVEPLGGVTLASLV
jgi:hypothetical protein